MRILVLVVALLGVAAQPPGGDPDRDADGHLKAEHQIPPGHYCLPPRIYDENVARMKARGRTFDGAHPCDCTYACHVDVNGTVTETGGEKTTNCKSYCSKDGRRCTCHVEEPCDLPPQVALRDMRHQTVAVSRRREAHP